MPCNPIITPEVQRYIQQLDARDRIAVLALISALKEHGHSLKAPLVKRIVSSGFHNLKELRRQANGKHFRILFAFDQNRNPVLLHAGDKQDVGFEEFYAVGIPIADRLFKAHQKELASNSAKLKVKLKNDVKVARARKPRKGK